MGFRCGIVGLPNVGKSTLFNALTQTIKAQAENYPFCTIEPNIGIVAVPDPRLEKLAHMAKSKKIIPTSIEFVDIAGLVKGASKGEGLGNQFLGYIRGVDAIIQVVRCFEDSDVTHVDGHIDPCRDIETIQTELILADLDSLERRKETLSKKAKGGSKEALEHIQVCIDRLSEGTCVDDASLQLLTTKPVLYVCNTSEHKDNALVDKVVSYVGDAPVIRLCASFESDIAQMAFDDQKEFLKSFDLEEKGLDQVIRKGYDLLHLITFFTVGPQETRAWTIPQGTLAPQAGAVIHTDFEKGFIRAEIIAYEDFVACGGELGAKNQGKMRLEGKEYVVRDGDIIHFRFNV